MNCSMTNATWCTRLMVDAQGNLKPYLLTARPLPGRPSLGSTTTRQQRWKSTRPPAPPFQSCLQRHKQQTPETRAHLLTARPLPGRPSLGSTTTRQQRWKSLATSETLKLERSLAVSNALEPYLLTARPLPDRPSLGSTTTRQQRWKS
jgi:hypothetical protein